MYDKLQVAVESLHIYPIKACGGIRVPRLQFTAHGLIEGDREWVVANHDMEVVWQGSHPQLSLVKPKLSQHALDLTAPGNAPVTVPRLPPGTTCTIRIWNDITKIHEVHEGIDAGDPAAHFLHAVTGSNLRLVRLGATALARDSVYRAHIVSSASLGELNASLSSRGLHSVDPVRFRPNIVISGIEGSLFPFLEESFTRLQWADGDGTATLSVVAPCIRCVVPNVDPATGAMADEPLHTVAAISAERHPGQPAYFGVYANAEQDTRLHERAVLLASLNF